MTPLRILASVAVLTLAACGSVSSATQLRGPNGSVDWWIVRCHKDGAACWRRASEACPGGFATPFAAGSGPIAARVRNGELTIRCKGPSAPPVHVDAECGGIRYSPPRPARCYVQEDERYRSGRTYLGGE